MDIAHISDDRGEMTLCGRTIYSSTIVDRWSPGLEGCFDCSEIASSRVAIKLGLKDS